MAGKNRSKRPAEKSSPWHLVLSKEIHPQPFVRFTRDMPRKAVERLIDAIGDDLKKQLRAIVSSPKSMAAPVSYQKCYVKNGMWCCQTCIRDPMGNEICEPPRCTPLLMEGKSVEPCEWDTAEEIQTWA
jgi:hypothetical protein